MDLLTYFWILFGTIIGQMVILLVGFTFLNFLPKNKSFPPLQKFALSYGLGVGIITSTMFICILLGIHSRFSFIPVLVASIIIFFSFKVNNDLIHNIKSLFLGLKKGKLAYNYIEYFCLIIIFFLSIHIISICFIKPIVLWDAATIWNSKAKYIFFDGNFNFINYLEMIYHLAYPLLVPLNITYFYSFYFQPYHLVQINFASFFFFLLIYLYNALREVKLDRTYSLLICTMIASITDLTVLSYLAMGDIILIYYYTISTIFLSFYFITRKSHFLLYSSIFAGFMALSKNEGLGLLLVNSFIFLIYNIFFLYKKENNKKSSLKHICLIILPALIIYIPWQIFCIYNQLTSEYISNIYTLLNTQQILLDLAIILIGSLLIILWCPFWIIFIIVIILNIKLIFERKLLFLLIICIFHIGLKFFVYIISPHDLILHLFHSLNREIAHLAPFGGFIVGVILFHVNNKDLSKINKNERLLNRSVIIILVISISLYIIIALLFYNLYLHSFIF